MKGGSLIKFHKRSTAGSPRSLRIMLRGYKERAAVKSKISLKIIAIVLEIKIADIKKEQQKLERQKCYASLQALFRKNPAAAHSVLKEEF